VSGGVYWYWFGVGFDIEVGVCEFGDVWEFGVDVGRFEVC